MSRSLTTCWTIFALQECGGTMVTDQQYWRLMKLRRTEKTLAQAAAKAGMDEKTARKYLRLGKPPCQLRKARGYRTRKDNFAGVWRELEELLEPEPGLEALTLMEHLCRQYPDRKSTRLNSSH